MEIKIPIHERSLNTHRQIIKNLIPSTIFMAKDVKVDVFSIKKKQISLSGKIFKNDGNLYPEKQPTIFFIPGTAFIAREDKFTDIICSQIAKTSKCQVITINHRLSPESQFPIALKDTYQLINFIINDKKFNVDKNNVVVSGYSSGANLALSTVIKCQKNKIHISNQTLISGIFDISRNQKEYKDFENLDNAVTEDFTKMFLNYYIPTKTERTNKRLSPIFQTKKKLNNLPKTNLLCSTNDRFRGDSEKLYSLLKSDSSKFIFEGDHALLWKSQDYIEFIGKLIKENLSCRSIPTAISSNKTHKNKQKFPFCFHKSKLTYTNDVNNCIS